MTTSFSRYAVLLTNRLDEYRMRLADGMLPVLATHDISLLVHSEDPFCPGLSTTMADMFRYAPPCGIIATEGATGTYEGELFELLTELDIPVISIAMAGMGRLNIRGDNESATRSLMAHLLDDRGVRRPVVIRGTIGQKDTVDRERLMREELARRGLELDEEFAIEGDFAVDAAYISMRELLGRRQDMDAVIASNDLSAMGAWRALTDEGLRVPQDVLLSGFDNDRVARINWPGLTTVDHDLLSQGAAAATGLIGELRGEPRSTPEVTLPGRLVVRGTTGSLGETPEQERNRAVAMAAAAQRQLAEQDALLAFNQAMMRCATIPDLVDALSSTHLERLGISRCILAMYELDNGKVSGTQLLLDYWDGVSQPLPRDPLPVHVLLHHELGDEVMVFQPLSSADRPLGYVLFEHTDSSIGTLPEILRIDLSRSLGAVLSAQDLRRYAQDLEDRVEQRTQELRQEIARRQTAQNELSRLNDGLQRSLMVDGLTGIANRAAFERHFDLHGPRGTGGEEMALLFVDVDHFKAYNDLYGHVMGDEALRQVASSLAAAVRSSDDLACRWGGEEFAALLPNSGLDGASLVAQRFMARLDQLAIPHAGSSVAEHLTASVGIALTVVTPGMSATELVEAADRALYTAKMLGRNCIYPPVPSGRQFRAEPEPVAPASLDHAGADQGADPVRTPSSGLDI